MNKKFSDLVKDSVNKDELGNVKGGANSPQRGIKVYTHACDSFACSTKTSAASGLCTHGDGICDKSVA